MATVSDLRSRVRSLSGIASTAVLSDADLDAFLSEAQTSIALTADFPFLVHTVTQVVPAGSDTVSVSLPRTSHRVLDAYARYVTNEKPWQLHERSAPFIAEDADGHTTEFSWADLSSELSFWPAPSKDIEVTVRFVLSVPQISVDADIVIPDQFVHAVSYLAAANILSREADESGRAQEFSSIALATTQQMRKVLLTSSRGSVVIGGRRGYRRSARRGEW